jgi:hypothetical protein
MWQASVRLERRGGDGLDMGKDGQLLCVLYVLSVLS